MGRDTPDYWARRAKDEGWAARSVYKLQQIDQKFNLLRSGARVLDVGASPGSWSSWALGRVGAQGAVTAVDLQTMAAKPGLVVVTGDVFDEGVQLRIAQRAPFTVVLSDAAPNTTGNRIVDTQRSLQLCLMVITLADRWLLPRGALVIKQFQGDGVDQVESALRARFEHVKAFKPSAVRSESFETYWIGQQKMTKDAL